MNLRRTIQSRDGFSLVEIIVALTITLGVAMALARATGSVARMSGQSANLVRRSASIEEAATALSALPWAQLPTGTTCDTVAGEYVRCITATDLSGTEKQFTIVATPYDPRITPDTIVIERGRALGTSPFSGS